MLRNIILFFLFILFSCNQKGAEIQQDNSQEDSKSITEAPKFEQPSNMYLFKYLNLGISFDEVKYYANDYISNANLQENSSTLMFDWQDVNDVKHNLTCRSRTSGILDDLTYRIKVWNENQEWILSYHNALEDVMNETYGQAKIIDEAGRKKTSVWLYDGQYINVTNSEDGLILTVDNESALL